MSSPILTFDGSDDYVQTTAPSDFGTTPFSVGGWVYFNRFPNSRHTVLSTKDDTEGVILYERGGEYVFWTNGFSINGGIAETGVWHHVIGTRDNSNNLRLYLDGENVGMANISSNSTTVYDLYFGADPIGENFLDGALDDIRVYNHALSDGEVKKVMDGYVLGNEYALYPMNEGSGTTLTDATTNDFTASINGATWSSRNVDAANTYSWSTAADWNASQSQDDVEHEADGGVGIGKDAIQLGQSYDHLTTTSEEAFYAVKSPNVSGLQDFSPAANDALSVNGVTKQGEPNHRFTGSLSFDGVGDYIELPTTIFDTTNFISFEGWFYPRETSENGQFLVDCREIFFLTWDAATPQGFSVYVLGDNTGSIGPTNLSLDTWHHVNMYWDVGTEIGLSVNGGAWNTYATSNDITNRNGPYYLGANASMQSNYFDGKMTELRFVADERIPIEDSLYQTDGTLLTGRQ